MIHYGGRGAVVVGEIDGQRTPRVTAVRDAWSDFDPAAIVTPNIWGYLWGKEAYGAMRFATALTNESIADALAMREHRPLYIGLAREILSVALARGVRPEPFDGFDPSAYLSTAPSGAAERSLDALVVHNRRSAKSHSGIWRDLAVRKRPTEVDAQLGIVVTLGAEAGVATPLTTRLVELIHEIERGERPQSLDAWRRRGGGAPSRTAHEPDSAASVIVTGAAMRRAISRVAEQRTCGPGRAGRSCTSSCGVVWRRFPRRGSRRGGRASRPHPASRAVGYPREQRGRCARQVGSRSRRSRRTWQIISMSTSLALTAHAWRRA